MRWWAMPDAVYDLHSIHRLQPLPDRGQKSYRYNQQCEKNEVALPGTRNINRHKDDRWTSRVDKHWRDTIWQRTAQDRLTWRRHAESFAYNDVIRLSNDDDDDDDDDGDDDDDDNDEISSWKRHIDLHEARMLRNPWQWWLPLGSDNTRPWRIWQSNAKIHQSNTGAYIEQLCLIRSDTYRRTQWSEACLWEGTIQPWLNTTKGGVVLDRKITLIVSQRRKTAYPPSLLLI